MPFKALIVIIASTLLEQVTETTFPSGLMKPTLMVSPDTILAVTNISSDLEEDEDDEDEDEEREMKRD